MLPIMQITPVVIVPSTRKVEVPVIQ